MRQLSEFEMWYGRDEPPPAVTKLNAGPLEMEFESGDLRYIRYGEHELVRRIYVAIRDVNWNTIPAEIKNLTINAGEGHFRIRYDAFHVDGPLSMRWQAVIEGSTDGVIDYTMNGVAETDFRYCRIGFCVLHPSEETAGSRYQATTPDGDVSGVLPRLVAPQRVENGFETPLFPAFSALKLTGTNEIRASFTFEGDLFEMEDQRNWTDGSFKTYCTPIALGYPYEAKSGQEFLQKVSVKMDVADSAPAAITAVENEPLRLTLGKASDQKLPRLGLEMASHGHKLEAEEAKLISRLQPDHLKVELHFEDSNWLAELDKAIATSKQIHSPLELAVFLTDDSSHALEQLRTRVQAVPVARIIVFHEAQAPVGTTSTEHMQVIRQRLSDVLPAVPFLGGTNGNFAELNRQRPDIAAMDGVAYTINPQVHGWDERTVIEAIDAQRDTVVTARSYVDDLPISISSVTLKPPFNQAATEEVEPVDPNELPAAVDQRQMSLFAATWTVGSIYALASGGADSVTYYETTGWRGLVETSEGSPLPQKFRSFPGMVFPVYWVFSWLADTKNASLWQVTSERPLLIKGFAFQDDRRLGLFAVNLQPRSQTVQLEALPDGEARAQRLNANTMTTATSDPRSFREQFEVITINTGKCVLDLAAYETAFIEIQLR